MTQVAARSERRTDHIVAALVIAWLAAAVPLAAMLLFGATGPNRFPVLRGTLHLVYVVTLACYLIRRGPAAVDVTESPRGLTLDAPVGRLAAAGAALALVVAGLLDTGLLMLLLAAAALVVLFAWRTRVTVRAGILGVAVSVLAFLSGGITFWHHGFVAKPMLLFTLAAVPPMFVAGGLLVARTRLGAVRMLERRYAAAWWSFLTGALMFAPLGLANAAYRARFGPAWVDEWWQPFVLPLWSGIVEEVVFRVVLVCLLFALLKPVLGRAPGGGIAAAVLASAIIFGLGHGKTMGDLLGAGLGFGLPIGVVFVRRDWEHAVGAHYMINLVPWWMALLAT